MGCTQSTIENEENVNRCKERKRLMERAVTSRNKFAGAHSAYAMSLKNTGAALSDFAQDEVVISGAVEDSISSPGAASSISGIKPPVPPYDNDLRPPPPLPASIAEASSSLQLQRASTMPELAIPRPDDLVKPSEDPIIEEDEGEADDESVHSLKRRSFSSNRSGGSSKKGISKSNSRNRSIIDNNNDDESEEEEDDAALHRRRRNSNRNLEHRNHESKPPPPMPENKGSVASWDYFFEMENVPGPTLADVEETRAEREEMERKMLEDIRRREMENKATKGKNMTVDDEEEAVVEKMRGGLPPHPPPPEAAMAEVAKRGKKGVTVETVGKVKKGGGGGSVSLLQVFVELDDCFLKASESTNEVSRMLEATRLHYHSNFADKRGNINHSERVMRVITWNKSFKDSANAENGEDDFDSEKHETLATVLDKILAWERKLYEEVKISEQMKLEYQEKAASLNKLKNRNSNTEALERKKAAVSHLHTRYIVAMQSMDSTVSEIDRLRDEQLYPKLISLVDGMATMWETMRIHHENQSKIAQSLKSLDISKSPRETSDHHHTCTSQLASVVRDWHSNLTQLITQQREYIESLNTWLKLNLVPIDTDPVEKNQSSPGRPANLPVKTLLQFWHDHLVKIPDEPARGSISNFAAVVETIWEYQKEELEYRNRCHDSRKDLTRKTREFENWYNKYMQRRTIVDVMDPDRAQEKDVIASKRGIVEAAKLRLDEDEEAYRKLSVQVRKKSLVSLKSCLPELFKALSDHALACSDMYRHLRGVARSKGKSVA